MITAQKAVYLRESVASLALRLMVVQGVGALTQVMVAIGLAITPSFNNPLTTLIVGLVIFLTITHVITLAVIVHTIRRWVQTWYRLLPTEITAHGPLVGGKLALATADIKTVAVQQSFAGALFNYGTIVCYAQSGNAELKLVNVSAPLVYAEQIEAISLRS